MLRNLMMTSCNNSGSCHLSRRKISLLLINKKGEPSALTLLLVSIFANLVSRVLETLQHNNTFAIWILGKFGKNSLEILILLTLKDT
jgi:hypothetical protein